MTTRRQILASAPIAAVAGLAGPLLAGAGPARAQDAAGGRAADGARRGHAPGDRGDDLGDAGGQPRPDAPGDAAGDAGARQPDALLVEAARLEEPDADPQHRRDLSHALLRHPRRRAGGARDPARRRRRHQRHDHGRLADAARGRRARRRRRRQGRQIRDPAARLRRGGSRRLHRAAVADLEGLRAAALDPGERQRRRPGQGGRLRPADQGLSALRGREPTADHLRRRQRRPLRGDDPLRPALLRGARPRGAERAVAAARPRDDRHAPHHRHRKGQALRSRRRDEAGAGGRRRPGARDPRRQARGGLRDAAGSRAAAGASPPRRPT